MDVFRSDNENIYLNAEYVEFYIPMYFFDTTAGFAEELTNTINVLGIFNIGIFSNGKQIAQRTLNMPTMITINVYDSEVRECKLQNEADPIPCKVVKYFKDAKIMSARIFDDDKYAKLFLKCLTAGSLPKEIPYSKALNLWYKNQLLTGVNFAMGSIYLELVLSVMFRNPADLSQKFSKIAETSDDYGYATASIRQICQYNSTFTALTYEDIDSMITTSLNKSREHKPEVNSPVEQIIKF